MTKLENEYLQKITEQYGENEKELTKVEKVKALDKKVKKPAEIFAYVFGIIGSLILGVGMCLAMKVIGDAMILGIVIGVVGIAMVSVNYCLYNKILKARRKKYGAEIVKLASSALNEN